MDENQNNNSEGLTTKGNIDFLYISSLFEKVKILLNEAKSNNSSDEGLLDEIINIQNEFTKCNDFKGIIFCLKTLANIREIRAEKSPNIHEKIVCLESALCYINDAVIQATNNKWNQPSVFKRQAIIKSKLADALHKRGKHTDANILEGDALKSLNRILHNFPDYAEGYLEIATASFNKLQWSLQKILSDIDKAENLFISPKHTKHISNESELNRFKDRMNSMRTSINTILPAIQKIN